MAKWEAAENLSLKGDFGVKPVYVVQWRGICTHTQPPFETQFGPFPACLHCQSPGFLPGRGLGASRHKQVELIGKDFLLKLCIKEIAIDYLALYRK